MLCVLTDSTDFTVSQTITYGCLSELLSWAKAKKQYFKSSAGNTAGLPSDLTGIVHAVIQKIHTCGASGSSTSTLQLKTRLPAFCTLHRSVIRALSAGSANCCLIADCLYLSSSASSEGKTAAERKRASRQNRELRKSEQLVDTSRHKSHRQDTEYRHEEQSRDTARRKTRRQDSDVRQGEQSHDTARRKTRRQDSDVRQEEQSRNTTRRKTRRQDSDVRQGEQSHDTARRKTRRQDSDVRQEEQSRNTTRRKTRRQDSDFRRKEQLHNTRRRKTRREDLTYRQQEAEQRRQHGCSTTAQLVSYFHQLVSSGPVYICTSCDQLLYKHSVKKATNIRSLSLPLLDTVLLGKISSNGNEYICHTCAKYIQQNKIPPCSIANNLHFHEVPLHLPALNTAEWRMLSPRLAFMQIHEAAVGKQLRIHGNVVCVPADICTTVSMLPRTTSDFETVAVQLKRRSQYRHPLLSSNVRPTCIREVGSYLVEHGELFKQEKISFSPAVVQSLQTDEILTVSDVTAENTDDTSVQTDDASSSIEPSESADTADDEDSWNEVHDTETERAGVFDTLFTSADFVEDSERSAVYGHIDEGRSDRVYSFAPSEGNKPISIFLDKHSEELSFPNIFWGNGRPDSHPVKVHYSQIVKSELRRSDRRVALCIDNIFYKLKKCQMHAVTGKVNVAVRKHKTGGHVYTAGQLRDADSIDRLIKFDDGYRVLKDLRGSPPYWEKAKRDLYAMIRQLGPAQLFVTLSAAETRWAHLLKILSEIVDGTVLTDEEIKNMTWSHKCRLISSDPVTCARHFDFAVQQFFNSFLKHPCSPFGELKDFWYRTEMQHRGSPHLHAVLWIANVPQYGVSDTAEVIRYIDSIITCQRSWQDQELDTLVERQVHKHTRTCKKQQRKTTVCRFGFPKYPMPQTEILEPLTCDPEQKNMHTANLKRVNAFLASVKPSDESLTMDDFLSSVQLDLDSYILAIRSSLKSATTFIRRSPSELRVNNYNVHCLKAWQANHDIQFVLDVYACASYITAYIAKGSRGMSELLRQACNEARDGCSTLKQQVRIIGNKFLNNVEVTAQEAVYLLLQLPLKRCSRQVVFVNTNPPDERVYLLKSNIDQLPDDAEVAESNMITRYSQRPDVLDNVCLADYAAYYDNRIRADVASNSDDEFEADDSTVTARHSDMPMRRAVARVIRTFQQPDDDSEKSARQKLMLYLPWRNEQSDLYGEYSTYAQHFQAIQESLAQKITEFEPYKSEVNQAQELLETADLEQQWDLLAPGVQHSELDAATAGTVQSEIHAVIDPVVHGQTTSYDLGIDLGLGHIAPEGTVIRYNMPDSEYFILMKSLNFEQIQFVYDTIHQLKTSQQPVHSFLSGGAGTGKSYVLRALRETAERFYKSRAGENYQLHFTATLAPTGKAAFIAGGATVHSVLHVPANQSLTYHRLDYESLNTLRSQISHVKLWLIDEISMVGHRMLSFIDLRLQEVNNSNRPFGGASIVVFGDLFQLPPVMDGFVFNDLSQSSSHIEEYSALAPNLWKAYFTMFELSTIMRQQDSRIFAQLLNRVREGNHSEQDLELLRTRTIAVNAPDYPTSAQHLFRTNAQVEMHNISVFDSCSEQKYVVHSVDTVIGAISDDMVARVLTMIPDDTRKTMQLAARLPLAVGCRYELSVNISVSDGLANGAGGVIKHIQLTSTSSRNA